MLVTCYLLPGDPVKKVCTKKHKAGKSLTCQRLHPEDGFPPGTIWHGEWDDEFFGDLVIRIQNARREYRNALSRWATRMRRLENKKCAPAFQAYLDSEIKKHATLEPKFSFNPPPQKGP